MKLEEKLDDLIVNISIFIVAFIALLFRPLVHALRRFALTFPLLTAGLALIASSLLIADKAITGSVDHRVLGFGLLLAIIGTAAIVAVLAKPTFHEFQPTDHKSVSPDQGNWLADL